MTSLRIFCLLFVHNSTVSLYLIVLSVIDALYLVTRSGNDWAKQAFGVDVNAWIRVRSEVSCQVFWFACSFLQHLCSWILVFVCQSSSSANFFISSSSSAYSASSFSSGGGGAQRNGYDRAKHTVLVLVLVLVCANAHYFWTIGLYWPSPLDRDEYQCTLLPQTGKLSEAFRDVIWPLLDLTLSLLAPNIVIACNLCYRCYYCCCNRRRMTVSQHRNPSIPPPPPSTSDVISIFPSSRDRDGHPTVSHELCCVAVVLSVWGLISTSPEAAVTLFQTLVDQCEALKDLSERGFEQRVLAQSLCSTVRDVFLSGKIFLYLFISRTFREVILERVGLFERRRKTTSQNANSRKIDK